MFDEDSFDDIHRPEEARQCVEYLSSNERNFRKELMQQGLTHEEEERKVKAVWTGMIKACRRSGFRSSLVDQKAKQFGV